MGRTRRFLKKLHVEAEFICDQFNKIIWPEPLEVSKILAWTSMMLTIFAILIFFVFDPASLYLVKTLSSLK